MKRLSLLEIIVTSDMTAKYKTLKEDRKVNFYIKINAN